MTKNQAIRVIAYFAQEYFKGSGCGLRSIPSKEEHDKYNEAIGRLKKDDYKLYYIIK